MLYAKDLLPLLRRLLEHHGAVSASAKKKVVFYGTPESYLGLALLLLPELVPMEVIYLVDRKAESGVFELQGHSVFPPSRLQERDFDYVVVLSGRPEAMGEMKAYLESLGLRRNADFFDLEPEREKVEFEWKPGNFGPLATKFYEWDYEVIRNITQLPHYYPEGVLTRLLQIAQSQGMTFEGKTIFEIGYGPSLIVPVVFCLLGAQKVYACDFVKTEYRHNGLSYENLPAPYRRLCSLVYEDPACLKLFQVDSYDAFFQKLNAIVSFDETTHGYHVNPDRIVVLNGAAGNLESIAIPDGEIDFAYSNGVLEHLDDLNLAVAQLARVMKPGGCGWHVITCAMHWNFKGFEDDPMENPLEFLKYHPDVYAQMQRGHWGYERPWRLSDYVATLEKSGLQVTVLDTLQASEDQLPKPMNPYFQKYGKEDLLCTGATFWTSKPALD